MLLLDELSAAGIDRLEAALAGSGLPMQSRVVHRFTPGLYIRETQVPAGTLFTTMEHRKEHPFVMTRGRIRVISATEGNKEFVAPFTGITPAGTRRVVQVLEDVVWTTFHVTLETDVEKIAAEILAPHDNPLLPGVSLEWRKDLVKLEGAA